MKAILRGYIFLFLFTACDFTPWVHREILEAQDLIRTQNYKSAIKKYENILKGNLNKEIKLKIFFQLGELYSIHLGDYKKSLEYFSKIRTVTEDPLWLVQSEEKMAEINFSFVKNYPESIENYKNLTSFIPRLNNYDFFKFRLARSFLSNSNYGEARKLFEEIIGEEGNPNLVRSYYYLGMIEFRLKKWKKSTEYWNTYIRRERRKDNIIQAKFLMANAYETMEELKKAYDIYYSLLGEYPNTQVIKNRLQSIYSRRIARKR